MIKALLDTNALYSGIHSPEGTPGKILIEGFEGGLSRLFDQVDIR